jgi:hypothetical protein
MNADLIGFRKRGTHLEESVFLWSPQTSKLPVPRTVGCAEPDRQLNLLRDAKQLTAPANVLLHLTLATSDQAVAGRYGFEPKDLHDARTMIDGLRWYWKIGDMEHLRTIREGFRFEHNVGSPANLAHQLLTSVIHRTATREQAEAKLRCIESALLEVRAYFAAHHSLDQAA